MVSDWFYIQFAVIGSGVDSVKVQSAVVFRSSSDVASQAIRVHFGGEGRKVVVFSCCPAVRSQLNSRSIIQVK